MQYSAYYVEESDGTFSASISKLELEKPADGFVQIPPTRDYQSVKVLLSDVKTTFLSRQGTNVSSALELAMNSFTKSKIPKSILLVTDGENHTDENKRVYELIKKNTVLLYAILLDCMSKEKSKR